ncbi:xanthine dehydrogenase family protein molybdopterin-binding subunit [Sphaerisporangium sp. NPDC088356]|uniref:xanthine dehydrogenase family protein molybdopterin-binding subunit n=1 Tax=Sphaerisporangium sp. NPDC088356 TaxID=3154871 RepID=UPI003432455F
MIDQAVADPAPRREIVGSRIPKHDAADYVTGRVTYVNDVVLPGMTHVALVRSTLPHARIVSVSAVDAEARPGVLAVVTAADLAGVAGPVPQTSDPAGVGGQHVDIPVLAADRVVYVGQPIAAVVAETAADARAAAAAVAVEYEPLPFVLDIDEALAEGAPELLNEGAGNVLVSGGFSGGDLAAAERAADHVVEGEVRLHRAGAAPMETRGYVANWDDRTRRLTVHATVQNPHPFRHAMATALGIGEHQIRVIAPRMGGSFGHKTHGYPEEVLICALAKLLKRPVKWIEDRAEALLIGGREMRGRFRVLFTADARVLGLTAQIDSNLGAPAGAPGWPMTLMAALTLPHGYDIPNCAVTWRAVVTNKAPWNGTRGYGKEVATLLAERVMDLVAETTDVDPAEVRRRNWVRPEDFPFPTPSGTNLDSGNYHGLLDILEAHAGLPALRAEQRQARERGALLGIGIAFEVVPELVDLPGTLLSAQDTATVKVDPSGHVTVLTGVTSPGGGNDTAIAQIVAQELGVPISMISVVQGDTDLCPYGFGNVSSRSTVSGGGAAALAARDIAAKLRTIAAGMLHTEADRIDLEGGFARVSGDPDTCVPITEVAGAVYTLGFILAAGIEPSLEATRSYRPGNIRHTPDANGNIQPYSTYSNGLHLSVVEIDPETGVVTVLRHVMVHDCGTVINPTLVEGQVHGAVAMGLGCALGEEAAYTADGSPVGTGFKTYLLPRSTDIPEFEILHQETPTPFTLHGGKGAGETGVGGAIAAVAAAVNDALRPTNTSLTTMPITPETVLRAISAGAEIQGVRK